MFHIQFSWAKPGLRFTGHGGMGTQQFSQGPDGCLALNLGAEADHASPLLQLHRSPPQLQVSSGSPTQ